MGKSCQEGKNAIFSASDWKQSKNKGNNILAESESKEDAEGAESEVVSISRVIPHYCGMSTDTRKRRWLVVLRAFFDESGTEGSTRELVFGGFIGRVEEWERASDAWDKCLHGYPSINYFKHHEAHSLDEQFRRFNRTSADAKVLALAETIRRFDLRPYATNIPFSHFSNRDRKAAKGMVGTRAYDWGFNTVVSGVLQNVGSQFPGGDKVDFIFDARGELSACRRLFDEMKSMPMFSWIMRRAGECAPGDDMQVMALQMADLLAGEFSIFIERKVESSAFTVLAGKQGIAHITCKIPGLLPDVLQVQKLKEPISKQAVELLRNYFNTNSSEEKRFTAEEAVERVMELMQKAAYFYLEWSRIQDQLRVSEEIQRFVRNAMPSKKEMQNGEEYRRFDETMRQLISVPHDEIKAKLDAEKRAKKRRKARRPSASDRALGEKD